jgi:hypothetical protein
MTGDSPISDVGSLKTVGRRQSRRTTKRIIQIGAATVILAFAGRQSIEWGIDPLNIGLHSGKATSSGVLYYELIGALLGFVVGSWVVLGRFRRGEVLMYNTTAMFHRVEDHSVTPTSGYRKTTQSRGGWVGAAAPTGISMGGGKYGFLRTKVNIDYFTVKERVVVAKINGAQIAYEQSDGSESNACVQLSDSDGNSLVLPINHPFRGASEWAKIVSDALKSRGVTVDERVGSALDGWVSHS